jgi:hypothetical protein
MTDYSRKEVNPIEFQRVLHLLLYELETSPKFVSINDYRFLPAPGGGTGVSCSRLSCYYCWLKGIKVGRTHVSYKSALSWWIVVYKVS